MSIIAAEFTWLLLFRKTSENGEDFVVREIGRVNNETAKIRCPLCKWSPEHSSRWTCWDCDHPEFFDEGCGTTWNTFETGGLCPGCSHQWQWTSCLRCHEWSKHKDWYE